MLRSTNVIATKRPYELDCDGFDDSTSRHHKCTSDSPRNTRTGSRSTAANTDRSTGPRNKTADNCTFDTGKCRTADADKRRTVSADTP